MIENGSNITLETLIRFLSVLGIVLKVEAVQRKRHGHVLQFVLAGLRKMQNCVFASHRLLGLHYRLIPQESLQTGDGAVKEVVG